MYISTCVVCVCGHTHTSVSSFMLPSLFLLYILTEDYSVVWMYTLNCKLRKRKPELPVAYSISYLSFLIRTYNFTISTLAYYECVFKTSLRMSICFQHFLIKKQCCIKNPRPTTAAYPLRQS